VAFEITRCTGVDPRWIALRGQLWPHISAAAHGDDVKQMLAASNGYAGFLALAGDHAAGFAEATIRRDYVNGCDTGPVVFLEGIFVVSEYRRRGVARSVIAAVETWGREMGCTELASDAALDNLESHATHRATGFEETERVVFFRKRIAPVATYP